MEKIKFCYQKIKNIGEQGTKEDNKGKFYLS